MTVRGEQTCRNIRNAARVLFAQKGYSGVTMKDICEHTGLSRGGLYRHYGSTAEIFRDIFAAENNAQIDLISQTIENDGSAVQALDTLLGILRREMADADTSLSLAICEYGQFCDSAFFHTMHTASVKKWTRLLEYGIDRGEFMDVDVAQIVDLLLYSYQGVRVFSRILPDCQAAAEHITGQIRHILISEERE